MADVTKPVILDETGQEIVRELHALAVGQNVYSIRFDEAQSLTDEQKEQARANIDAAEPTRQVDVANSVATQELKPNTVYVFATRSSNLALTMGTPVAGDTNVYVFQITIDSTTLPTITGDAAWDAIDWEGGAEPTWAVGKFYEVSIMNGKGFFREI